MFTVESMKNPEPSRTDMKTTVGIIGGSGLTDIDELKQRKQRLVRTPYGEASAPLVAGQLNGHSIVFLARHGQGHTIPPHRVNYRANVYALAEAGVKSIVAVAAVGGIGDQFGAGRIVVPDQIIDYTHSRASTYFDGSTDGVTHVDFTYPYAEAIRAVMLASASRLGFDPHDGGCYAATQGPRFETAAEINRIEKDGGSIVGMTGMPEAVLARELGIDYATVALVVNPAAGRSAEIISLPQIMAELDGGMVKIKQLLVDCLPQLQALTD